MNTPNLDALLKEVDALAPWQDATGAALVPLAPRLAAMLRVAVEALREEAYKEGDGPVSGSWDDPFAAEDARKALARIETLAGGGA